jgi:hypothetical protein
MAYRSEHNRSRFKQWLEIRQDDLSKIGQTVNASLSQNRKGQGLEFDEIFGNKLRLVVPLEDQSIRTLKTQLKEKGFTLNIETGMVSFVTQTNMGPKTREKRVGAVLAELEKKEPGKWSKWIHWWEKNKVDLNRPQQGGVSMVISRSPIDIVRMSDHSEWKSCHSVDGGYFRCAVQEAKTGGAIAYIVRNADLNHVPNLQAKDIFADKDRRIRGIEPLERIRLRKFGKGSHSLLVPELRTYGTKHVGFLDALTDWARNAQGIDPENPPDFDQYDIHGGSYQDNPAGSLWANLTGDDEYHGISKYSVDQEEDPKDEEDPLQAELEQAEAMLANHNFDHYHVSLNAEEVMSYSASVSFEFYRDDFIRPLGDAGVRQVKRAFSERNSPGSITYAHYDNGHLNFDFEPNDRQDLQNFENFLSEVENADKEYDEDHDEIREILIRLGYFVDWRTELSKLKFKNLIFEWWDGGYEVPKGIQPDGSPTVNGDDRDETNFASKPLWIGDLEGSAMRNLVISPDAIGGTEDGFPLHSLQFTNSKLLSYARRVFPVFVQEKDIKLLVANPMPYARRKDLETVQHPMKVYCTLNFEIKSPERDDHILNNLEELDNNFDHYMGLMQKYFMMAIKPLLQPLPGGPQTGPTPQISAPRPYDMPELGPLGPTHRDISNRTPNLPFPPQRLGKPDPNMISRAPQGGDDPFAQYRTNPLR